MTAGVQAVKLSTGTDKSALEDERDSRTLNFRVNSRRLHCLNAHATHRVLVKLSTSCESFAQGAEHIDQMTRGSLTCDRQQTKAFRLNAAGPFAGSAVSGHGRLHQEIVLDLDGGPHLPREIKTRSRRFGGPGTRVVTTIRIQNPWQLCC